MKSISKIFSLLSIFFIYFSFSANADSVPAEVLNHILVAVKLHDNQKDLANLRANPNRYVSFNTNADRLELKITGTEGDYKYELHTYSFQLRASAPFKRVLEFNSNWFLPDTINLFSINLCSYSNQNFEAHPHLPPTNIGFPYPRAKAITSKSERFLSEPDEQDNYPFIFTNAFWLTLSPNNNEDKLILNNDKTINYSFREEVGGRKFLSYYYNSTTKQPEDLVFHITNKTEFSPVVRCSDPSAPGASQGTSMFELSNRIPKLLSLD